jgi:predicted dehydrogenase
MDKMIRWGILGCGNIADKFAADLQMVSGSVLRAVAARNPERAQKFAKKHNAERTYNNYTSLVNDKNLDVIYVATTHNFHYEHAALCLAANKAVLCEKPICINAQEAQKLAELSRKKNTFLMEAMWTRFLPAVIRLIKDIDSGIIGPPQLVQADFGITKPPESGSRFYEKKLAAGALLDLGIYTINFANIVFRSQPKGISGYAQFTDQGVDRLSTYNLIYSEGRQALLSAAIALSTPHQARIYGDKGRIVVDDFYHPQQYQIILNGKKPQLVNEGFDGFGYLYEAREVQQCLLGGKTESTKCPLDETVAVMRIMDDLRKQWGLRYPNEN